MPAPKFGRRLPMRPHHLDPRLRGQVIQVMVLPKGFEWEGRLFRSLSAVAKAVTGAHWNGYLFFNLNQGDEK